MAKRKYTKYTDEQIQSMIDLYVNKGISTTAIARELNMQNSVVCSILHKHGVTLSREKYTDEQINTMIDMYVNKGLSTYAIAKELNIDYTIISRILKKHGVTIRRPERYAKSEKTKQMIDMYNSGMTVSQIADALGKSYDCIDARLRYHGIIGKTHTNKRVHTKKKNYKYNDAIDAHINNIQNRNKSKVPNIETLVGSEVTDVIAERAAEIEKKLYDAMEIAFALTDEYEQICIERTKLLENEIQRQTDDINRQREELNERETMLKKAQKYINK